MNGERDILGMGKKVIFERPYYKLVDEFGFEYSTVDLECFLRCFMLPETGVME